jgi:hypothetical protein
VAPQKNKVKLKVKSGSCVEQANVTALPAESSTMERYVPVRAVRRHLRVVMIGFVLSRTSIWIEEG